MLMNMPNLVIIKLISIDRNNETVIWKYIGAKRQY